ncbi:MAG: proteasome accessory factor PafA2 family protein [Nitrospira sp.]|nr:proteasome accessory factor PafA2 family protein [Nitrospira sp.]
MRKLIWVLAQWASVLNDLRGDYHKLVGRVDWASKLWLLECFREAEGLDWGDPLLKSLDLEYHNLNPSKGLYYGLVEEGRVPRMTTDALIQIAMEEAPRIHVPMDAVRWSGISWVDGRLPTQIKAEA